MELQFSSNKIKNKNKNKERKLQNNSKEVYSSMIYGIILTLRQTSKVEPHVYKQATVASLRRAMDIPE